MREADGTITFYNKKGEVTGTGTAWTKNTFCEEYSQFCPMGYPSLIALCDLQHDELTEGIFDSTSILNGCGSISLGTCDLYPWLCDESGDIGGNICDVDPAYCEEEAVEYDPCAADIYECLIGETDFDYCISFPALCNLATEIKVPIVSNDYLYPEITYISDDSTRYVCKGVVRESFGNLFDILNSVSVAYDFSVDPGTVFSSDEIYIGARTYKHNLDTEPVDLGHDGASVYGEVEIP